MSLPRQQAAPKATYQDVLDTPEHRVAEIMSAELIVTPRPASPHAFTHRVPLEE